MLLFDLNAHESYQNTKAVSALLLLLFSSVLLIILHGNNRPNFFNWPLYSVSALCLYNSIYTVYSDNSMPFHYMAVFLSPCFFIIFYALKPSPAKFTFFLNLLFLLSGLAALYQFLFLDIERPYSLFGNPIFAAEFMGSLFPFVLLGLKYRGIISFISLINMVTGILAFIIMSSRGPVISLIISSAIFILFAFRSSIKRLKPATIPVIAVLTAVIILVSIPAFMSSLSKLAERGSDIFNSSSDSVKGRIYLSLASLKSAENKLIFGAGPGAIRAELQPNMAVLRQSGLSVPFINSSYTHNDFIQIISETGLAGLILFFSLLLASSWVFQKSAPGMPKKEFSFTLAAASSVIFFIVESFFNFPLFIFPSSVLFYSFLGITASGNINDEYKHRTNGKFMVFIYAVPLISVFLLIFASGPGSMISGYYARNTSSLSEIKRALQIHPSSYSARFMLADYLLKNGDYYSSYYHFKRLSGVYNSADMFYNAGLSARLAGMEMESLINFNRAYYLCPDLKPGLNFTGKIADPENTLPYDVLIFREVTFESYRQH